VQFYWPSSCNLLPPFYYVPVLEPVKQSTEALLKDENHKKNADNHKSQNLKLRRRCWKLELLSCDMSNVTRHTVPDPHEVGAEQRVCS
jgi:hypothetical protein